MAVEFQQLQHQLMTLLEQNRALNMEVATVNEKLSFVDNSMKEHKYEIIELKKSNQMMTQKLEEKGEGDRDKRDDLRLHLINMKNMSTNISQEQVCF